MDTIKTRSAEFISYFFVLLFCYASFSKILDFENFQLQIAQSPILSAYAGLVSYGVLVTEFLAAGLLLYPRWRTFGLFASLALMAMFTTYIFLILNYSDFIPCSCGGILEKLGWREHLLFNTCCILLAILAIFMTERENKVSIKSLIPIISLTVVVSCGLMIVLFLSSEHVIKSENNFTRRFLPHPISDEVAVDLKASSFYFAGYHGDTIFLGNREAPLLMATLAPHDAKAKIDTLKLSDDRLPFKKIELSVSYPYFSLSDGTVPIIFDGQFPDLLASKADLKPVYFSQIKMTSAYQYLFRTTLTESKKSVLGSMNTATGRTELKHHILEKQIDGLFDTDGQLSYDALSKKAVYTYLYRNQYIVSDNLLLNKKEGKTIDTVRTAKITLRKMSDGKTKMAAPPVEVNLFQDAFDGYLYNVSALRGQFESRSRWNSSRVVDVYNYNNKNYQYSFYIKNRQEHKVRSIIVTRHYLYALIGNELIRYQRRR
jgi:hypothetical protein